MRLIDAEILFEKVGNIKPKNKSEYELLGKFMNMITNSPTVERPHGEWVEVERQGKTGDGRIFTYTIVVCSECGEQYDIEGEKFCPNCGAFMRGKEE